MVTKTGVLLRLLETAWANNNTIHWYDFINVTQNFDTHNKFMVLHEILILCHRKGINLVSDFDLFVNVDRLDNLFDCAKKLLDTSRSRGGKISWSEFNAIAQRFALDDAKTLDALLSFCQHMGIKLTNEKLAPVEEKSVETVELDDTDALIDNILKFWERDGIDNRPLPENVAELFRRRERNGGKLTSDDLKWASEVFGFGTTTAESPTVNEAEPEFETATDGIDKTPPDEEIAAEMEISVERVREIRKIAQEPVSLDSPYDTTQTDAAVKRLFLVTERLREKYDREPTNEELANALNWSVDYVRETRIAAQEIFAVDDDTEDDLRLDDFIEDHDAQAPADAASFMLLKEQLNEVLDTLTAREKEVLRLRFGLKDRQERTLEEVGKSFNVTRHARRNSKIFLTELHRVEGIARRRIEHCQKFSDKEHGYSIQISNS